MGNQKSKQSKPKYLPCLNQSDENGRLLIENSKIINPSIRLFVTTKNVQISKDSWLSKGSLVILFTGNIYGIGNDNEYSFNLVTDYNEFQKYVDCSKLWYMINGDNVKPVY